ncbi:universal stress protein [Nocardiopsis baichengensis]|uniref:universal stress protein n=1 Tax=Nocardiopsis baichengensis TaxID=280240 RepID=UPI0003463E18|nr:universal stress protein [Nocardiopsis baichengensis]
MSDDAAGPPLVAGVNGGEAAIRALDWAAAEADAHGLRLRIVYAFSWPLYHSLPTGLPEFDVDALGRRIVHQAEQRVRHARPGLETEAVHITGDPGTVLLGETRRASAVVLGSRGVRGLNAVLLGSVGLEVASLGACPVVVVPDRAAPRAAGRIVVGVDGSDHARHALDWALREAEVRGSVLRAVCVPRGTHPGADKDAREVLAAELAGPRAQHPGVVVEESTPEGHAARALAASAEDADLLAVGSRGRGGFAGMLLGSVGQSLLAHSPVPVAVVHRRRG